MEHFHQGQVKAAVQLKLDTITNKGCLGGQRISTLYIPLSLTPDTLWHTFHLKFSAKGTFYFPKAIHYTCINLNTLQ